MFVSLNVYISNNESFETVLPIRIKSIHNRIIELASYKEASLSSGYDFFPLLKKLVNVAYSDSHYFIYLETYSSELVEELLQKESLHYTIYHEGENTKIFKVRIQRIRDLEIIYPALTVSGLDSLFTLVVHELDDGKMLNKLEVSITDEMQKPAFTFHYDLQGIFILGTDEWLDSRYIKNNLLSDSEIIDELTIKL
ncbi:hypothetical protein [Alkalihalobacillus trypoxylicola]|uniref:Uncharacterized protein n=1 Tax=Alkalihalobacillus trypoxylicola TaxID=519424 RepID=A0A162E5D6_9BACI|nr:hypothetical protein [Alkalihalobacillus trypoxylicola]KYG31771.1 hypothetical protein AZF04_03030 [Alkalihalobacillus trypoxylicola]